MNWREQIGATPEPKRFCIPMSQDLSGNGRQVRATLSERISYK